MLFRSIYLIILFLSVFALFNFIDNKENIFLSKKINLGLDLQGGSYLLLEVNSEPIVEQYLQQKLIELRKNFKKNNIKYQNCSIIATGGSKGLKREITKDEMYKLLKQKLKPKKVNNAQLYLIPKYTTNQLYQKEGFYRVYYSN